MNRRPTPEAKPDRTARSEAPGKPSPDVVLIHDVEPNGKGLRVLRYRDRQLEAGAVRPLEHGKPLQGELVRLKPRREMPLICDVDVELASPSPSDTGDAAVPKKGPAQVATDQYRENWDRIWRHPQNLPN